MALDDQSDDVQPPDLTGYINADLKAKGDAWGIGGEMPWVLNVVKQGVLLVLGTILRLATAIVTKAASAFQLVLEQDNPEVGRLASSILGTMFGHDVIANIPGSILNPGDLDEAAPAVGAAVLRAVFGPISIEGGGVLEPGVERAEGYLGAITNMVTRGFLLDMLVELVPHWHLQFVHHLEQGIISGLGLGRVARTVMRPIVTTLIADPALWALNLAYRPKLAPEATAIGMWQRGELGEGELDDVLGRQGWGPDTIHAFKIQHTKQTALGELTTLYAHAVLADEDVVPRLQREGYDQQSATETWEAAKLRHFDAWAVRE